MNYLRALALYVFIFFTLFLNGCQTATGNYLGVVADAKGVISFDKMRTEVQQWQDTYITVDSAFEEYPAHSLVTGKLYFSIRSRAMFKFVSEVTLWAFFLDENNRILSFQPAPRMIGYRLDDVVNFSIKAQLPQNAVAYTFGYDASFFDDMGIFNHYWNFPDAL